MNIDNFVAGDQFIVDGVGSMNPAGRKDQDGWHAIPTGFPQLFTVTRTSKPIRSGPRKVTDMNRTVIWVDGCKVDVFPPMISGQTVSAMPVVGAKIKMVNC